MTPASNCVFKLKEGIVMRFLSAALAAITLSACATSGAPPVYVGDTPSNRTYWDHYQGEGYRIKVARDVGKMGSLCMTQVFIDGKLAAEIGQGEAVVFKVASGSHDLKIAPALKNSTCQSFYSAPQFQVQTSVTGAAGELKDFRYGFSGSGLPFLSAPSM